MNKSTLFAVVVFLISIPIVSPSEVRISTESIYKEGVAAFEHEDYKKAVTLLDDAVRSGLSDDKLLGAYLRLYMCTMILDDTSKAQYYFDKCKSKSVKFDVKYSVDQRRLLKYRYKSPNRRLNPDENEAIKEYRARVRTEFESRREFAIPKGASLDFGPNKELYVLLADLQQTTDEMSKMVIIASLKFYDKNRNEIGASRAIVYDGIMFPAIVRNYVISAFESGVTEGTPWARLAVRTGK